MPDFNLTKSAQAVDDSLALIDEGNNKLFDTVVAAVGVPLNAAAQLANTQLTPTTGQTLYHTGNVGVTSYTDIAPTSVESIRFGSTQGRINISKTSDGVVAAFYNGGSVAGSIEMTGLMTGYFTSSDPRLKDFLPDPTDEEINDYFNRVLDSAAVFTWKSDPKKAKVWGFNAHKASDNGLHMASEGRGPRDMAIGEEYQSAVLDEEGNELEPAKYVTSAGVDQSKDIAALVFKIAQLEQRIKTLEGV